MTMNHVQFQPGLSMAEFMDQYGSDDKCEAALIESRWPAGFACPECDGKRSSSFRREGRLYFQCTACRHQCSVISGTIFAATKLPLSRWFLAMHLLTQSKNNVAALELKRHLGVCYKTAWLVKHKLMEVMRVRDALRKQRNLADYAGDLTSDAAVAKCLASAQQLLTHVRARLAANRPD